MKLLDSSYLSEVLELRDSHKDKVENNDFGIFWSDKQILKSLEDQQVFGLFDDFQLQSFIIFQKLDKDLFEIHLMMTRASFSRKGYMKQLFNSWVQSLGGRFEIWLEVHSQNLAAIRFYEKNGFQMSSSRPQYYPDGSSALLYSLKSN